MTLIRQINSHRDVGAQRQHQYDVRDYGAAGDGTTDDTLAIQAAIDAARAAGGGTVFVPQGTHLTGPLVLKYRVSLVGDAARFASVLTGSVLKLKDASDAPLITSDQVNGAVIQASAIGPGNQTYQHSSIENLTLHGNKDGQTSIDADVIRLVQVWNVTIKNCCILHAEGFGLRALDCNHITVRNNDFVFAPIYLESVSDSLVAENQIGGGNGRVYPVIWLAGTGEFCWQNLIPDNVIFNNSSNTAIAWPTVTADAGTNVLTASTDHELTDNTPVVITTSGTLPAGLVEGRTYYVDVQSATTVKLCTTRKNLGLGTFVDITDAGSGTHSIQVGHNANVYLSDPTYCKWNLISGNRIDQAYGAGIWADGAFENDFADNVIVGSGLNNGTGQAGIELTHGAVRNSVHGGLIDGSVYTSGGMTTNQDWGVRADATSFDTRLDPSTHIRSHATANVALVGYTGEAAFLSLGSDRFELMSGTPAIGTIGGGRRNAWLFDAASEEIVFSAFETPAGWRSIRINLWWVNAGAGAGDVTWGANVGSFATGDTLNAADGLAATTTTTAGAQDVLTKTVLSTLNLDEGELHFLRVKREAANIADTLANDAGLVAVRIERV